MFDPTSLFISVAHAAEVVAPVAESTALAQDSSLMRFLPLFLIFAVFYFILIRPQQKKLDEQSKMLKALKKGDKVYVGSGIVATIHKIEDDEFVIVDLAKDVHVKVLRASISGLVPEKSPVESK